MRINLAFQGGGAKLCSLLAAAEAIQSLSKKEGITINAVAGTSAGAVVATLLAANQPIGEIRYHLREFGSQYSRHLFPVMPSFYSPAAWLTFIRRRSFSTPAKATEIIRTLLTLGRSDKSATAEMGKLPIRAYLVAADLEHSKRVVYSPSTTAEADPAQCVMDSCSIPWLFRSPKNLDHHFVDGGLCENLPIHVLRQYEGSEMPIFGISFQPTKNKNFNFTKGNRALAIALLDTILDTSVARAIDQIGEENILLLPVEFGTLDFANAIERGLGDDHYMRIMSETERWFYTRLATLRSGATQRALTANEVLQRVHDVYSASFATQRFVYERHAIVIVRYDLFEEHHPDFRPFRVVRQVYEITPALENVHCMRVGLRSHGVSKFGQLPRAECVCRTTREHRAVVMFPIVDKIGDKGETERFTRSLAVFFTPFIERTTKNLRWQLVVEDFVEGEDEAEEYYSISNPRGAQESIGRCDVVLAVPKTLKPVVSPRERDERWKKIEFLEMDPVRLAADYADATPSVDLHAFGWTASDCEPGSYGGIKVDGLRGTQDPDGHAAPGWRSA